MEQPLVSVFVITYKHADFIKQTLESILSQKTTFNFELVIADDCSPDATSEMIHSVISMYREHKRIRYFEHEENLGMYGNFMFALNQCHGTYIAVCEGDDYWTDPLKLQKQVAFLEKNPEFEVCFTNISIVNDAGIETKKALITDSRKTVYERQDLPIWAPTLTRVFRNRDFSSLPSAPGLDTIMLLWQSQFGQIKFLNEITGAYRKHAGGIYSAQTDVKRKEQILTTDLISLQLIDAKLYGKYFGMLLKKLVAIYALDKTVFKTNSLAIKHAFKTYRNQMSILTRLKVQFAISMISFPFLLTYFKSLFIKILNRLFLY